MADVELNLSGKEKPREKLEKLVKCSAVAVNHVERNLKKFPSKVATCRTEVELDELQRILQNLLTVC